MIGSGSVGDSTSGSRLPCAPADGTLTRVKDRPLTRATLLVSLALCLLVLGIYGMVYAVRVQRVGGALQFAVLATSDTPGNRGYDGQYYYRIALDPSAGQRPVPVPGYPPVRIDRPAYRYQRIGYPLLARAVALGRRERIATALVLVNVAAIALGTLFVALLLARNGVSPLYAVAYATYVGQVASFWRDLAEPLATVLIALALLLWRDERPLLPSLALLAAALTKETALLFAAPLALYLLLYGRWRPFATVVGVVLLPYALWQLGLWAAFGQSGVGGADRPPLLPLGGLAGARTTRQLLDAVPAAVLPALLCLALLWRCVMLRWRRATAQEGVMTDQWTLTDPCNPASNRSWAARLRPMRDIVGDLPTLYLLANLAFVLWLPAHSYADLWASGRNAQTLVVAGLTHPALATTRLRRSLFVLWACCSPLLWL